MIYPFSVLDTRTKEWRDRKNWWITNHQIQSELGREKTESITRFWESETKVSVFDPVLCELMYDWYVPKGGSVLDIRWWFGSWYRSRRTRIQLYWY